MGGHAVPQRILDIVSWAKRRHCRFKGECRPCQMGKKSFRSVAVAKMGSHGINPGKKTMTYSSRQQNSC